MRNKIVIVIDVDNGIRAYGPFEEDEAEIYRTDCIDSNSGRVSIIVQLDKVDHD